MTNNTDLVVGSHDDADNEIKADLGPVQEVPEALPDPVLADLS